MTTTDTTSRTGHETKPCLTVRDEVVTATCNCGDTWSAREADPSHPTYAEWAMTHTTPAPDYAPTYDEQRQAYDVACGLRELADFITRHPEFADLFGERDTLLMSVGPRWGSDETEADRFHRLVGYLGGTEPAVKDETGNYASSVRQFGPVNVEVFTSSQALGLDTPAIAEVA